MTTEMDRLEARLAELETRLAFQDDWVGELDQRVSEHTLAIAALRRELESLRESLRRVDDGGRDRSAGSTHSGE
jgi:uncharacterized coiled-coil protein SlyX